MLTKDDLVAAARALAARRGRSCVRVKDLARDLGISSRQIYANFDSIATLNRAAGLVAHASSRRIPDAKIFEAMREGFLAAGDIVTRSHLDGRLPFDHNLLWRRFPTWAQTLEAFHAWAQREAPDFPYMNDLFASAQEWRARTAARRARRALVRGAVVRGALVRGAVVRGAVVRGAVVRGAVVRGAVVRGAVVRGAVVRGALVRGAAAPQRAGPAGSAGAQAAEPGAEPEARWPSLGPRAGGGPGGGLAGEVINRHGFLHAPVNEARVMILFGALAEGLGLLIETVRAAFPDCEAKRRIGPGRWERVRIEFEFRSRAFRDHGHDPQGCETIVCWEHNWPECPLEVLELKTAVAVLAATAVLSGDAASGGDAAAGG